MRAPPEACCDDRDCQALQQRVKDGHDQSRLGAAGIELAKGRIDELERLLRETESALNRERQASIEFARQIDSLKSARQR